MMAVGDWLPDIILQEDYDSYFDFFEACYRRFAEDFILDTPQLGDIAVKSKRHEAYEGKDHSFWHCVEEQVRGEDVCEENRVPKLALCERIPWPRPIIEHTFAKDGVLAWGEVYRGHGTKERVHLFIEDEGYVVVLDPRGKDGNGKPSYYFLWTTFICDGPRRAQAMRRRYKSGRKLG